MKLSTRPVLLILGCLVPILAAQTYTQVNSYAERHRQLSSLVLSQAERANAGMVGVVENLQQFGIMAGQFTSLRSSGQDCDARLTALRRGVAQYRFLAMFSPMDGSLLCASDGMPPGLSSAPPSWLADLLTASDPAVGQLVSAPGEKTPFLPIVVRIPGAGDQSRLLVAGLHAGWLQDRLAAAQDDRAPATSRGILMIADRDGTIVGRIPDAADWIGRKLPEWLHPLVNRDAQGVETIVDPDGRTVIAAFVPNAVPPSGLTVINALVQPKMAAYIDRAAYQDFLVVGGAAIIALILAWVAGRRFIYQPTEALLLAARRWRDGDLNARASLTDAGSEFEALAQSFNAMAAGLQAREMERRMQASFLEAQVAERTRELSESNNRLQVEIAGREKTEAALHQAQKLQAVGQLAGGIAHDFNNMLATVLGNLELMERRVSQAGDNWAAADTERLLRLIERATGAVTRGGQLTSRLLAFSRRQRLAARSTDVNALLRELITLASSTLGRRVQVVSELADDLWPAMVDPSQVEAAILNLCLNARDAMPEGGQLTIQTMNLVIDSGRGQPGTDSELSPGAYVQVCISDTGVGMSADVKARAFDPFFTTKGPGAGSGLGLSQVYGMVRQSGGIVTIDSTPNEGTRVTLCLPRTTTGQADTELLHQRLDLPVPGMQQDLVLVVDDDHAVRQVTVEMARDLGCEVAQASGGEQALLLVDQLSPPPKLILLDYVMPGMNGLQLARALRDRGITAPIALVTGYAELSEADIAAGQLSGLLRKPFTIRELQALLTQLRASCNTAAPYLEAGLVDR